MSGITNQFSYLQRFLFFFAKKLRLGNPWKFKVPFLITVPYLVFLLSDDDGSRSFFPMLLSVTIIIGVAGIGYLTNDLGDREKDKLIGKENVTTGVSFLTIAFLFILFFILAICPWFFLPFDRWSVCLLTTQFLLFFAYAFPPFRLKEKGIWGVFTDSGYSHVFPAILASYTFYLFVDNRFPDYFLFLAILCSWQFFLGIRNILFHQLKDFEDDLKSDTVTFVTEMGTEKATSMVKKIILPLEILCFVGFLFFIAFHFWMVLILVGGYWVYKLMVEWEILSSADFRTLAYKFLDDVYIQWIPFAVLILLCVKSFLFWPLLLLHFILFRSEFKSFFIQLVRNKISH